MKDRMMGTMRAMKASMPEGKDEDIERIEVVPATNGFSVTHHYKPKGDPMYGNRPQSKNHVFSGVDDMTTHLTKVGHKMMGTTAKKVPDTKEKAPILKMRDTVKEPMPRTSPNNP